MRWTLGITALLLLSGCTHRQLTRSTVKTASTIMDIQYRIVLDNLARLSCEPEGYPSHIDLADGVVQINDSVGFGSAGGFSTFGGDPFGFDQLGPEGERQVTTQWGADATTDPERLTDLQDLYRVAMGLPPLPTPQALLFLRSERERSADRERRGEEGDEDGDSGPDPGSSGACDPPSSTSPGGGGSTLSAGGGSSGDASRQVPIEILLADVPPPGWFCLGGKKDVPHDAVYVGRFGDRYAWVTAEGIPDLARFTVTVLSVVKFKPQGTQGGGGSRRGLAVTR